MDDQFVEADGVLMILEGRDWRDRPGASPEEVDRLRDVAPITLPESYLQLLSISNGGEGPLPVQPWWLQLDSAGVVIECLQSENYGRLDLKGFFIIGSNGGGEYVAVDIRSSEPLPIVFIDMVAGPESAELLAPDFEAFVEMIGLEQHD